MRQARRCGARTRSGRPCQSPAMANGRCYKYARRAVARATTWQSERMEAWPLQRGSDRKATRNIGAASGNEADGGRRRIKPWRQRFARYGGYSPHNAIDIISIYQLFSAPPLIHPMMIAVSGSVSRPTPRIISGGAMWAGRPPWQSGILFGIRKKTAEWERFRRCCDDLLVNVA
jgi:hypothetical protein